MRSKNTPHAIKHKYSIPSPNSSIPIGIEPVIIEGHNHKINSQANLSLEFFTNVRLQARVDLSLDEIQALGGSEIHDAEFSVARHPHTNWKITGFLTDVKAILSSVSRQRNQSLVNMTYLTFFVLNFKQFVGSPIRHSTLERAGRIILGSRDWKITIDDTPSTLDTIRELQKIGGYGITHVGKLERETGKSFTNVEAQELLDNLLYFLSFVRGFWTPPILPVGYDNQDQIVWEEIAVPYSHRWEYVYSWFPTNLNADINSLSTLFERFVSLVEDSKWERALRTVIHWYIECNILKTAEGSIVLAQTALELLSWMHFIHDNNSLSHSSFNRMDAADQIGLLFSAVNIPLEIPQQLTHLSQYAKKNTFEKNHLNGPRAITSIRNTIVHPGKNQNPPHHDGHIVVEAKRLILWYLELSILRKLGYSGEYSSRVHDSNDVLVPWASE